jgi:hypothetical protein
MAAIFGICRRVLAPLLGQVEQRSGGDLKFLISLWRWT